MDTETEALTTLTEMEAEVEKTYLTFRQSGWEWAKAITRIHDSKLYPHSSEPDGWASYMETRWKIGRSQAFRYIQWVHDEIKLLPGLDDEKSPMGDSTKQTPPRTPQNKSERASRKARKTTKTNGTSHSKNRKNGKKEPVININKLGDPNDWGTVGANKIIIWLNDQELKMLNKGLNDSTPDPEKSVCGLLFFRSYRHRGYTAINRRETAPGECEPTTRTGF
jgi:hypothetical protein